MTGWAVWWDEGGPVAEFWPGQEEALEAYLTVLRRGVRRVALFRVTGPSLSGAERQDAVADRVAEAGGEHESFTGPGDAFCVRVLDSWG